jgi:uncharacterized protein (DUF2164 family)
MNRNTKSLKDLVIIYSDKLVEEVYNQALQDALKVWENTEDETFEEELNKLRK